MFICLICHGDRGFRGLTREFAQVFAVRAVVDASGEGEKPEIRGEMRQAPLTGPGITSYGIVRET